MGDYKEDRWVNGEGVLGGRAAYIRKNVSLSAVRKADYPTLLLVSLIYHEKSKNGLPASNAELYRLDSTEEQIADHFCAHNGALFALCVTTNGTRDIFLFVRRKPTEEELAAAFHTLSPSVDYDFALRQDSEWRPFMTLLPQTGDNATSTKAKLRSPWWRRLLG